MPAQRGLVQHCSCAAASAILIDFTARSRLLRTVNILVCCCCVGYDRVAGVREMQALDLVRDDGRPCLR